MSKQFWLKFSFFGILILILGIVIYLYFPRVWGDVLYPLDYEGYIIKYAKEYNLNPTLTAAVIYTESRFNKESISRVGARGLMQIMPQTGRSISERLGEENFTTDSLLDPETSIRYGSWYLRYLLDNYDGNQNAALAGYNGGGTVGDRYVISRENDIPAETAGFIRTINFAQGMYQKLYAEKLNTNFSLENVAEKIRIRQDKKETWMQKIMTSLRAFLK